MQPISQGDWPFEPDVVNEEVDEDREYEEMRDKELDDE